MKSIRGLLTLLILTAASSLSGTEQDSEDQARALRLEYEAFGKLLDWNSNMRHSNSNDPLRNIIFHCGVDGEPADQTARRFIEERAEYEQRLGRTPHLAFFDARARPKFRERLVPLLRIGDYGLYAWPDLPEPIQRAIATQMRAIVEDPAEPRYTASINEVNFRTATSFTIQGQRVSVGDAADLRRLGDQREHERQDEKTRLRAANLATLSAEKRHAELFDALRSALRRQGLDNLTSSTQETAYASRTLESFARVAPQRRSAGKIPVAFVAASAAKAALAPLPPVARVGDFGIFATPDASPEEVSRIEAAVIAVSQSEEFLEKAFVLGIDDFGNATDLRQLVARTPEHVVAAPTLTPAQPATVTPVPPPTRPVAGSGGTSIGPMPTEPAPTIPPTPPVRDESRGIAIHPQEPANPLLKGVGICFKIPGADEELMRKNARRQAELKRRIAAKTADNKARQAAINELLRLQAARNLVTATALGQQTAAARRAQFEERDRYVASQVGRGDAVSTAWSSGTNGPRITLRNITDVFLTVTLTYSLTIDGETVRYNHETSLAPLETKTVDAYDYGRATRAASWSTGSLSASWRNNAANAQFRSPY